MSVTRAAFVFSRAARLTSLALLTAWWCGIGTAGAQQEVPDPELTDAISRELTVTNNLYQEDVALTDAVSRELTVTNNLYGDGISLTDAISRELTVTNNLYRDGVTLTDAISREITVANDMINPVQLVDAVSREMTVFNDVEGVDPDFDGVYTDDGDGVDDPCATGQSIECDDNCPATFNPDQRDGNGNGDGDACDAPEVVGVSPGDNTVGAPRWTDVVVTFSEPVDPDTVLDTDGDGTAALRLLQGGLPIAGSVTVSADGLRAVFDPVPRLAELTVHTVDVADTVADPDGETIPPYTSSFETGTEAPNEEELADAPTQPRGEQDGEEHGRSMAPAGDVDGDGTSDWLVGAPGWDAPGGLEDAGRVLLYLGTTDPTEREAADVVFEGSRAHGRVGTSVDGGRDVDGDGVPDIVIGAEDWDGSAATGPGRAYLYLFDPSAFPDLGQPGVSYTVDLEADAQATFVGRAPGDRAGRGVALSDDLDGDGRADLAIGAPGADRDGTADRGEVYAVHAADELAGMVDLGQIGVGGGLPGTTYLGEAAGDRLGWSVDAGRDVDCDGQGDIVAGAPGHDPDDGTDAPLDDAGASYLDLDALKRGITDIGKIGEGTSGRGGLRLYGDTPGGELGFATALAADTNGDRCAELLAGAPAREVPGATGEAAVFYGGELGESGPGAVSLATLKEADNEFGRVYAGDADNQAGAEIGYAVDGAGDVNGDGLGDMLFGAPGTDAQDPFRESAGATYLEYGVYGQLGRGITDIGKIGESRPGVLYYGQSALDRSGSAVAGIGDVDADGEDDIAVGAPERDASSVPDAGQSYVLTEEPQPVPESPDPCGPAGCTVTDLDSGAQLDVPEDSLAEEVVLNVQDLLQGAQLPEPAPSGTTLLGAARYTPRGQDFSDAALPTAYIAVREALEDQLTDGESFDLYVVEAGSWVDSDLDGTVTANPRFAERLAVSGTIDPADTYAVFLPDLDEDGTRDGLDGDTDGDGLDDVVDNCPSDANAQQWDCDGDGTGDACDPDAADSDGDTRADACDNCPSTWNEDQLDGDGDGEGDACDACPEESPNDADGDGLCCGSPDEDNCCDVANDSQEDTDGDGVGDACDTNPTLTVSSDPADEADFATIQEAVDAAVQSGTRIVIHPGSGPYNESVTVDEELLLRFSPADGGVVDAADVVVDGGAAPAFRILSTAGTGATSLRGLTLRGSAAVEAEVATQVVDCALEDVSDTGLLLTGSEHRASELRVLGNVNGAARVAADASLTLQRSRFEGLAGVGVDVEGSVRLTGVVLAAGGSDGIRVGPAGSLTLESGTVADHAGAGVATTGGSVTITDSILWGNAGDDLTGADCASVSESDIGVPDCAGVNGSISEDPLFDDDYGLLDGSPCLEFGDDGKTYDGNPCRDAANGPRLEDHDGDGIARTDLGALERRDEGLAPRGVSGVAWLDATTLGWDPVSGAERYHVYRVDVAQLAYELEWTCRDDLDTDLTDTQMTQTESPAPAAGWAYVITAEDDDVTDPISGTEGTLGCGTCAERSNWTPCP